MIDISDMKFEDIYLLDSKDIKEINNNIDYLTILVKNNMKEKRFKHSLSVAKTCELLASFHHIDKKRAYIAGLLHDVTKELSDEDNERYIRYFYPNFLQYPKPVWHSFTAKRYLKEYLHFQDKGILNAIFNHTICNSRDKLSMIIYIADKREPLRNIDDDILEIAKKDLKRAYILLKKDVEKYLTSKGENEIIR